MPTVAVTATPVDGDNDGKNDKLHVTAGINAPVAGQYLIGVRLLDASGWRVTSTVETVALTTGSQTIAADLSGRDIGDAGASGPATLRITVRTGGAPLSCSEQLFPAAGAGTLDASTFDSWATTLTRLRGRLATDVTSGQVSGAAATGLAAALDTPSPAAPDLAAFRGLLSTAPVVSAPEVARLDSLAARLIAQAAAHVVPPPDDLTPFTDGTDPAGDGVG